jgi:hypothetical protein
LGRLSDEVFFGDMVKIMPDEFSVIFGRVLIRFRIPHFPDIAHELRLGLLPESDKS